MGKLQRVFVQLKDLSPGQSTPFQEAWRAAEEELGALRARVDSVAATLGQTVPQYTQVRGWDTETTAAGKEWRVNGGRA